MKRLIKDRYVCIRKERENFDCLGQDLYNGYIVTDDNGTTFQLSDSWFIHTKSYGIIDVTCPIMITKSKEFPKIWKPNFIPVIIGLNSFRYFVNCRYTKYTAGYDCLLMAKNPDYNPEHSGMYIAFGSYEAVRPLISTCVSATIASDDLYNFTINKNNDKNIKDFI